MNPLRQPNKSYLFQAFNRARKVANSGLMSWPSLRKALGLAQSIKKFDAKLEEYGTTAEHCHCEGYYHTGRCYHVYAVWLRQRANQWQDKADLEAMEYIADVYDKFSPTLAG